MWSDLQQIPWLKFWVEWVMGVFALLSLFSLSLEGNPVTAWKLWTVHHPLLRAHPSLGRSPVMTALKSGQLKRLFFPHWSRRPLEDSESTAEHNLAERIRSVHQFNRVLFFVFNLPKLVQTCSAQKQISPCRLHCLQHFLNWKSSRGKINK